MPEPEFCRIIAISWSVNNNHKFCAVKRFFFTRSYVIFGCHVSQNAQIGNCRLQKCKVELFGFAIFLHFLVAKMNSYS